MTVKLSINNIKKYSLSIQSIQVVYRPRDVYTEYYMSKSVSHAVSTRDWREPYITPRLYLYNIRPWYISRANIGVCPRCINQSPFRKKRYTEDKRLSDIGEGICLVSKPVFFGKYHLQAWYISIIPPNMWLSLPEDKSREHRNVKYYYF